VRTLGRGIFHGRSSVSRFFFWGKPCFYNTLTSVGALGKAPLSVVPSVDPNLQDKNPWEGAFPIPKDWLFCDRMGSFIFQQDISFFFLIVGPTRPWSSSYLATCPHFIACRNSTNSREKITCSQPWQWHQKTPFWILLYQGVLKIQGTPSALPWVGPYPGNTLILKHCPHALPNTLQEILSVVGGARSKVYASKKKQKLCVMYILPFKETKEFCGWRARFGHLPIRNCAKFTSRIIAVVLQKTNHVLNPSKL